MMCNYLNVQFQGQRVNGESDHYKVCACNMSVLNKVRSYPEEVRTCDPSAKPDDQFTGAVLGNPEHGRCCDFYGWREGTGTASSFASVVV